jgi:hypothetical protein
VAVLLAVVAALGLQAAGAGAEAPPASEYEVKAAFLVNFSKFVEWPAKLFPRPDAPVVIGVLGENPFGGSLAAMTRSRSVGKRPLVVREISDVDEAAQCHMVFIAASERRLAGRLTALAPAGVLTVGEVDGFAERGGIIQFTLENNRVRFLINPAAAAQARLQISAKLLDVATVVHGASGGTR